MGASHFILTTEKDFAKNHAFEFDMILSTVDDSAVSHSRSMAFLRQLVLKMKSVCRESLSKISFPCSVLEVDSILVVFLISLSFVSSMLLFLVHSFVLISRLSTHQQPEIKAQDLASNAACISVSHIGSKKDAIAMLKLASENGIKTWSQIIPMKDVGKAIEAVKENKVRYRYVLKQDL